MVGENPKKKHPEFIFLRAQILTMESYGSYAIPAPRLQFLWLPLDVNSLCSRFQASFFPNDETRLLQ
jgi:hypothetical protein